MSKTVVSIVKTSKGPSSAEVEEAVRKAVALAGGIDDIVKPGNLVIIKPNVVCDPGLLFGEQEGGYPATLTRPDVCRALVRLFQEKGARAVIAESCGVGGCTEDGYRRVGYDKLRDEGIEVIDLKNEKEVKVSCPKGKIFKSMNTWELVANADLIVSVPVMKTHDQAHVTLGLKNLKGLYTDKMKKRAHTKQLYQQVADWATVVTPRLTVVDGITAMEGAGPLFGIPVEMDLIFAGKDPVATDAVTAAAMGFDPKEIGIITSAAEHGLGTMDLSEIEIAGEPLEKVRRRFIRTTEDHRFELPELWILHSPDTCTGCRLTFGSALVEIVLSGLQELVAGMTVLTGVGEIPDDVDRSRLVTIGNCVPMRNRVGKAHVDGCPPMNRPQMRALMGGMPEFEEWLKTAPVDPTDFDKYDY